MAGAFNVNKRPKDDLSDEEQVSLKKTPNHDIQKFSTFSKVIEALICVLFNGSINIDLTEIIKCCYKYLPGNDILLLYYYQSIYKTIIS